MTDVRTPPAEANVTTSKPSRSRWIVLAAVFAAVLAAAGFGVVWHDYPMAHAVCPQEIGDIRTWLSGVLGA